MIFIQRVLFVLSPKLGEGISNTQQIREKYHRKSLETFLSHVLQRFLLNLNIFCKHYNCESHRITCAAYETSNMLHMCVCMYV